MESQAATEAEIAQAAQEAAAAIAKQQIQHGEQAAEGNTLPGTIQPLRYVIPPSDQGSWVGVWELNLDAMGRVYGKPTRAPRQQLGLWLQKKRSDGGPRFTVEQPDRIAAEPQFRCVRRECGKKLYTRIDLFEHVEFLHPREFRMYRKQLDQLLEAASAEDSAINEWLEVAARTPESGVLSVVVPTVGRQEKLDLTAGTPTVQTLGVQREEGCATCDWKFKEAWSEAQRSQFLMAHIRVSHKDELE